MITALPGLRLHWPFPGSCVGGTSSCCSRRRFRCAFGLLGALFASSPAVAQLGKYQAPDGSYQAVQGVAVMANAQGIVSTLSAANASGSSADQNGLGIRGMKVGINCTAVSGTSPTLAVAIQGKDPSGTYFTILQSASITTTGFTLLSVYPGIASTANVSANDFIPQTWRINYTIGGTTPSFTCTISELAEP